MNNLNLSPSYAQNSKEIHASLTRLGLLYLALISTSTIIGADAAIRHNYFVWVIECALIALWLKNIEKYRKTFIISKIYHDIELKTTDEHLKSRTSIPKS